MEKLEQRITSMELCELINKLRVEEKGEEAKVLKHCDLMRKIKKELEIMEKLELFNQRNISLVKYKDNKGESRPCYSLNASGMRQILNSESTYVRVKTEEYIEKLEEENSKLKETQKPQITEKQQCILAIYEGGENGLVAAKRLSEIEVEEKTKVLVEKIEEDKPKVEYTDNVLQAEGLITTTAIAKDFGMSARKLNNILNKEGIQYKQGGQWFLYSQYQDKGYMQSSTDKEGHISSKWTQTGRKFLIEFLLDLGYMLNKDVN